MYLLKNKLTGLIKQVTKLVIIYKFQQQKYFYMSENSLYTKKYTKTYRRTQNNIIINIASTKTIMQ